MKYRENKEYRRYRGRSENPVTGTPGFPGARATGKARASKRWAGMKVPRPKKIKKDGKWVHYRDYLRGAHWHRKRKEALNYWGYTCMSCGITDTPLQVHHTHYDDLWKEDVSDLRIYCGNCHIEQDKLRKST